MCVKGGGGLTHVRGGQGVLEEDERARPGSRQVMTP